MQRPRRRHALAAALVITVTAGCGSATASTGAGPETPNVSVAVVATESVAGLYIAQNQGYFHKLGLHVTVKTVTSASEALPALLHGSVDVVAGQYTTFIQAQAAGTGQFRVLAPGWNLGPHVEELLVPKQSPIFTVPQLRGQTIAVNAIGGIDQIITDSLLRGYDIQPGQVHFVAIPFQAMGAALAAHRVDAAYLSEPYITEAEQQHGAQVLFDADTGATQGLPVAGYTALKSWALRYPRTAAAFAHAIDEGNAQVTLNPGVFQKAMEDQLHLTKLVADVMAPGTFPIGINAISLQRVANILFEYGALKKQFNVSGMLS